MRLLLLSVLLSTTVIADDVLILSGIAYHNKPTNSIGRDYDVFIEGIGYQHRHKCSALECSYTALVIMDSNSNFQPIATFGLAYNMFWNVNIGAEAGITSRVRPKSETRKTYPLVLPKLEIDSEWLILSITYIPELEYSPEVVYANVGLRF